MDMKQNITKLFNLGLSNYKISKETGIAQTTLGRFTTKESEIGNMTLNNAEKLNEYYNKIKREIKMKNTTNTLNNNYKANGEDEKYATYYEDFKHLKDTLDIEGFEEDFGIKVNELSFPIVVFDSGNSLGGYIFDTTARREDVMEVANDYFTNKNDDGVWEFEEYNVFEESDVLRFEDIESNVLGYVAISDDAIEELNKGVDPISDGWEDGIGNEVSLDGWNLE